MISIIIPTLNAAETLPATLASLLDANQRGLIREVIITDGGSEDATQAIAEDAGAVFVRGAKGRGGQLKRGAAGARGKWLLFLHADTQLSPDWVEAAQDHLLTAYDREAGVFQLSFSDQGIKPKMVAWGANLRARLFQLPYGDQGLLIAKSHYQRLGGYADMPLFEDVNLIRRIIKAGGRRALRILPSVAMTSAVRYLADGYWARVIGNAHCLALYFRGVPPTRILEIYNGTSVRLRRKAGRHGKAAARRKGQNKT